MVNKVEVVLSVVIRVATDVWVVRVVTVLVLFTERTDAVER